MIRYETEQIDQAKILLMFKQIKESKILGSNLRNENNLIKVVHPPPEMRHIIHKS